MLAGYSKVLESEELPSSMRQIAVIRVASLKMRNDAREQFLKVQTDEKKTAEKQQSLIAERGEIEDRIKQNNIDIYAAVGTLRTSSLQVGNAMLYRSNPIQLRDEQLRIFEPTTKRSAITWASSSAFAGRSSMTLS